MKAINKTDPLLVEGYNNRITVMVIGCGGTGSLLLHTLARMNTALVHLSGVRLELTVFDDDVITQANLGRQAFTAYDIGRNKAITIVERINRQYRTNWLPVPDRWRAEHLKAYCSNMVITCVDNMETRKELYKAIPKNDTLGVDSNHSKRFAYWMDCGNTFDTGNVIIGHYHNKLMPMPGEYPEFRIALRTRSKKKTGSCSLAEALGKQHFMINSWVANTASTLLWDMIITKETRYKAAWINIKNIQTRLIKV